MGQQLVIDMTWWQGILGLLLGAGTLAAMVGGLLRLWIQPQVGRWIDLAQERERRTIMDHVEGVRRELRDCQGTRPARVAEIEAKITRAEHALAEDVSEIKQSLRDLGKMVPELAGVKAEVAALRDLLRTFGPRP